MPSTVVQSLHILAHLIFLTALQNRYIYPHFMAEEIVNEIGKSTCLKSHRAEGERSEDGTQANHRRIGRRGT